MTDFTRDEVAMLLRHASLQASSTRYSLQHLTGTAAQQKRRREGLVRRLAVYEGAQEKLDAMLTALGPLPGLDAGSGMREVKYRDGSTARWADVRWDELSAAQQHDVMHGGACGHPTNRPASVAQAASWRYWLSPDKSAVIGVQMPGIPLRKF